MLNFHANVFAVPSQLTAGPEMTLREVALSTYAAPAGGPPMFDAILPVRFEEVQQRLLKIDRMDIEPDGYFLVAGGEQQGCRWQIDGHLFEYHGKMHRVEMHGSCSEEKLDELLSCFGWPECPMVFQLVHEGVTLSESDFRKFAAAEFSE
ncbi:hypothetical protein [Aeoliella mucimassa]|uniref:Uncharacterized protein n=1 Tax=Aeoliella mucimassa TaxID=2527972 RepID=A0A518AW72_9BACT|nr:hypothetical protein [Aeoliella mucimassa]QDU58989.1 hypothetical protein Pan181_52300 [Aeoliella mucimassa]